MKSCEELVSSESYYYIYAPSKNALDMFLYPLQCGWFIYKAGYSLRRESFDNFLLMYIVKGEMTLEYGGKTRQVGRGTFVLLDCRKLHAYSSPSGWECLWCHFDGKTARAYYNNIISHLGNVFSMADSNPPQYKLSAILDIFHSGSLVREPLMNKYLTDILTAFLLYTPTKTNTYNYTYIAEEAITYINEHFAEDISVGKLAKQVGLSQYHFIRTFKRETGFTPHEYIINTRIASAKYLLKNTKLPIKSICIDTGFSCESVFSSAFKKHLGLPPAQYRSLESQ